MRRCAIVGLLAALASWVVLLGVPASAWACAPESGGALPVPPIEFLGRLTSLRQLPSPSTGTSSPTQVERTAAFVVVRVFRGSLGPSISLSTQASGLQVGMLYTVPVFTTGRGAEVTGEECGPQPVLGNPTRLIGYVPSESHPALLTVGAGAVVVGAILALVPVWAWRRQRGLEVPS